MFLFMYIYYIYYVFINCSYVFEMYFNIRHVYTHVQLHVFTLLLKPAEASAGGAWCLAQGRNLCLPSRNKSWKQRNQISKAGSTRKNVQISSDSRPLPACSTRVPWLSRFLPWSLPRRQKLSWHEFKCRSRSSRKRRADPASGLQ